MKIISKVKEDREYKYKEEIKLNTRYEKNLSDNSSISLITNSDSAEKFPITIKRLSDRKIQGWFGLQVCFGHFNKFLSNIEHIESVKILNIPFVETYGHCLHDVIPKLLYEDKFSEFDKIFICGSHILESLINLYQINFEKVYIVKEDQLSLTSDKIVVQNDLVFHFREKEKIKLLKQQIDLVIEKNYKSNISNRLIYCSRNGSNTVNHKRIMDIDNESQIISLLKSYCIDNGLLFTIFNGEENGQIMSHINQLKLFSEAKIVVGPHGTAMSNVIYLNPLNDCKVCEFTSGAEKVIQGGKPFLKHYNLVYGFLLEEIFDYYLIPFHQDSTPDITIIDIDNLTGFLREISN